MIWTSWFVNYISTKLLTNKKEGEANQEGKWPKVQREEEEQEREDQGEESLLAILQPPASKK